MGSKKPVVTCEDAICRIYGLFHFALFDKSLNVLLNEKPFYCRETFLALSDCVSY